MHGDSDIGGTPSGGNAESWAPGAMALGGATISSCSEDGTQAFCGDDPKLISDELEPLLMGLALFVGGETVREASTEIFPSVSWNNCFGKLSRFDENEQLGWTCLPVVPWPVGTFFLVTSYGLGRSLGGCVLAFPLALLLFFFRSSL